MRAPRSGGSPRRIRSVAVVLGVVGVALAVGIGTASAGDHRGWGRQHRPRPSASASRPVSPPASRPATPVTPGSSAASPGATGPTSSAPPRTPAPTGGPAGVTRPPANAGFDYQIGQAYQVPAGVTVVSRDREAAPAAGAYNICYLNGFQAQPGELADWKRNHDDLLLKSGGAYVVDGDWNEVLLDTSTAAKREGLTTIVAGWMDGCAARGYRAVEIDNLDSWTRSKKLLTQANAVAYAKLLATAAHSRGLAIAQKNTVEIAAVGRSEVGFDFAIAEECANYEISDGVPECQGYVDAYGSAVIVIEYDATHFQQACSRYGSTLSIVQRDRDVTAPGSSSYVFKTC